MDQRSVLTSTKYRRQQQKCIRVMKHVRTIRRSLGLPRAFSLGRVLISMALFRESPGCIIKTETDVVDSKQTHFLGLTVIQ